MSDDIHLLAGAYSLDALDLDERRRFERHVGDCPTCRDEVAGFRATAAELADAASVPPPPALRSRVLDEISTTRQLPPTAVPRRADRTRVILAAAAALVAVAITAGAVVFGLSADSERDDAVELASLLTAPDAITTELAPTPALVEAGSVRVVWSPAEARAVVIGRGVAAAGEGLTYELWSLTDGTPRPAGLFEPDDDGEVVAVLDGDVDAPDGWGITIEPAGGSPAPTGDILYLAEV